MQKIDKPSYYSATLENSGELCNQKKSALQSILNITILTITYPKPSPTAHLKIVGTNKPLKTSQKLTFTRNSKIRIYDYK